jgi:hypothetical protein
MDAIGAALAVVLATTIALGWEQVKARRRRSAAGDTSEEPTIAKETRPGGFKSKLEKQYLRAASAGQLEGD